VFLIGVLPALFTLWIRRHVREPEMWQRAQASGPSPSFFLVLKGPLARITIALTLMNAATMFAWWGLNLWIPGYLSLPPAQGGLGYSTAGMTSFVVAMQVGMWFGYVTFGFISDRFGRRPTYVTYLIAAAALVLLYASARSAAALFLLGPLVAFFGTGYFSGFGAISAEVFPTAVRATAQGVTYNIGRLGSAAAPLVLGTLAQTRGFGAAFTLTAAAFVVAAVFWVWIPETRGQELR
jgi:MFS family permease